jgi:hypothetical protein
MLRAFLIALLTVAIVGCRQSQRTQVVLTSTPLTNQLRMQPDDSWEVRLPSGRTVAVWCVRPRSLLGHAEPTDSKSGLKTVWGEVPFRKPKEILAKAGTNSHYAVVGWKSYISPGMVLVNGYATREYDLLADNCRLHIVEDSKATNCLPVTIRVARE